MWVIGRGRLAAAAAVVALATASAQEPAPIRDAADYLVQLEQPERVERLQVSRVVAALGLRSGQIVADLGSGSGLFTRPLARVVGPQGRVYAVDIDETLLVHVARTAAAAGLGNITTVLADPDDSRLPEAVDLVFVCDTLHHIADPSAYLAKLRPNLKPGGRVAVIDFTDHWPSSHESSRYGVEQLDGWMSAAGFIRYERHEFLESSFFVVYGTPRLPGHD